ncbi:MAG: hypothetical protein COV72_01145 [Candidatus Omnitrophica bacterium CG11_big_fil_rev_8_21_14_0_20_42_13]|uniref:Cytochrome C biogenesis protein transmembrane domain-containing protein n=1 Tax=Candidatus Ghiorseimicrobium undicola TaxID=1974746 RepID=A0A2H0LZE2_9BACT|nr:MAG: hypothetical protein COV72_01145 [Candidatus Omnitrophica bacterium CG11_big_fil_rev_8_21_14_0_20_42_13]
MENIFSYLDNISVNLAKTLDLNSGIAFILVFAAGVIVSFTPCIYPLIPVTVGFIGARNSGSKLKGFLLSLAYVVGMAITYSLLGAISALGGKTFGSFTNKPIIHFFVGNIFLLMGISMLGVFNISLPFIFCRSQIKGNGVWYALLLGVLSCFVISPCTAPVLGAILVFVGTKQNILYGISLLFTFACGTGFVLVLAGTFTALLGSLPKSGRWMERVKKFCGFILILAAEYFFIKMGGL